MSNEPHSKKDEFIPVNQVLNSKPQLGPIPGEQVIPWVILTILAYLICQGVFGLDWVATLLASVWACATWWILTGSEGWRFLSKFYGTPTWRRGGPIRYESLLQKLSLQQASQTHREPKTRQRRRKIR